jgi:hypothetical protein
MSRGAAYVLVTLLVWALVPGLAEVTENLGHLLSAGHTAHAASEGDDHSPRGDEHGCSGTFHLCSCHASTPMVATRPAGGPQLQLRAALPRRSAQPHPAPHLAGPFRPPRA